MRAWVRQLPNLVTASRGLAGLGVAAALLGGRPTLALAVYVAAASTDLFDGWLARRLDAQSPAGLWLDPLSDRVLGGLTWLALGWVGRAPWWLVVPIFARNGVAGLAWWVYRARGIVLHATLTGRVMTTFEAIALPVLLVRDGWFGVHWSTVGVVLGLVALALSVASGAQYAFMAKEASPA